ncbi:MAG: hypothetical protein LBG71_03270 [Clostridiales Family XIII bacterium]|nr:hypothetical protein [Clostridiales Family XIII bacterium]
MKKVTGEMNIKIMTAAMLAVLAVGLAGCVEPPASPDVLEGAEVATVTTAGASALPQTPSLKSDESDESDESGKNWECVERLSRYLGRSIDDILYGGEESCEIAYVKENATEYIFLETPSTSTVRAIFDGPVWDGNSRCKAVLARDYQSAAQDLEYVKKQYGNNMEWRETGGSRGYCAYAFKEGAEARIYPVSGGTRDWLGIIVCETGAEDMDFEKYLTVHPFKSVDGIPQYRVIDVAEREKPEWENARRFMSYIGKSFEEIKADFPNLEHYEDSEYEEYGMTDKETGAIFIDDGGNGRCSYCEIPQGFFFEGLLREDGTASREDLMSYWPVEHAWYKTDGCAGSWYKFLFDDMGISLRSYWADGSIYSGGTVYISKRN